MVNLLQILVEREDEETYLRCQGKYMQTPSTLTLSLHRYQMRDNPS